MVTFTSQINEDQYKSKVNIKEILSSDDNNGIIIAVITNKIYIFNYYDGEKLKEEFITDKEYFLSPIRMVESEKYAYLIGYAYDLNKLYLSFYEYNNSTKTNTIVKTLTHIITDESQQYQNIKTSCEIMIHSTMNEIMVCFLNYEYFFTRFYININDYSFINSIDSETENILSFRGFKSAVSPDKRNSYIIMNI